MARLDSLDSSSAAGSVPAGDAFTFLGSYWLLSQLAVGEFCTIHRARSILSATARVEVAVKRLRPGHQVGPARARLLREARVGLTLRARNLVRVLEIHDEPELFLVMEHIEGATLRELLARSEGCDRLRYILPTFADTLRGLSALHHWKNEEGAPGFLVHQAPSLGHMLVGIDGVTRLIDLSNVYGHPLASNAHVLGRLTQSELAPEQQSAGGELDPRCDIFLVGSALQAVLARVESELDRDADHAHMRARCEPLRAIAARACAEKPSARFWSADEMAYQLERAALDSDLFAAPSAVGSWVHDVLMPGTPARASGGKATLRPQPAPARPSLPPPAAARVAAAVAAAAPARPSLPPPVPAAARVVAAMSCSRAEPRASTAGEPFARRLGKKSRLHRVTGAAGAVALLAGALLLGVRGLQHTPTALASRLTREAMPAKTLAVRAQAAEPKPVVTSLAPWLRAHGFRARADRASDQPRQPGTLPHDAEVRAEQGGLSTVATIAASIRASVPSKNLFVRPRMLRAELPSNPY